MAYKTRREYIEQMEKFSENPRLKHSTPTYKRMIRTMREMQDEIDQLKGELEKARQNT